MALDHPEAVNKLVLLDIVSTYDMYSLSTREFAKALFQWYFFTQEAPLPEDMILSSRKQFFRYSLHIARYHSENDTSAEAFPQDVYDEYLRHYNVETIHAICEEYRAGETVEVEVLREGQQPQGIGDGRPGFSHPIRHLFLGEAVFLHQHLIAPGLFGRVQVLSLEVLDQAQLHHFAVIRLDDDCRHLRQAGQLGKTVSVHLRHHLEAGRHRL